MKRDIASLSEQTFDLVIVGGGIFGIFAAWDATLRGLSVALVEKKDFSHATSANHFKMIHGGIRYLQHGDLYQIRESSRERSALMRIAPHLTQPLPIVIPTYGRGIKGKAFLSAGMCLYDLLTCDRNWRIQEAQKIPRRQYLSRQEVLDILPDIDKEKLTGGAIFYDGQFYHPTRLAISVLRSAVSRGAKAANYVEVTDFLRDKNRVTGVMARDLLSGDTIQIRSKVVLNAAGPWAHRLLKTKLGLTLKHPPSFSRDLALVVKRKINHKYGFAFLTKSKDAGTLLDRGSRHLFVVPWKKYTLIGVWHKLFKETPENITVSDQELKEFIREANDAYPGLKLSADDILTINTGLTLQGDNAGQEKHSFRYGHRSILIDHAQKHNLEGLVTLIGLRATTARGMAQSAMDMIMRKMKRKSPRCQTETTPIYGGDIKSIGDIPAGISPESFEAMRHHYGSKIFDVLKYCDEDKDWINCIGETPVLKAEVVHGIREEMAQKLTDVVFRSTDLGVAQIPGDDVIQVCADIMSEELGWSSEEKEKEIKEVLWPHERKN